MHRSIKVENINVDTVNHEMDIINTSKKIVNEQIEKQNSVQQ